MSIRNKLSAVKTEKDEIKAKRSQATKKFDVRLKELEADEKNLEEQAATERTNLIRQHIDALLALVPEHNYTNRQDPCSDENVLNEDRSDYSACHRCRLLVIRDEEWNADQYDVEVTVRHRDTE